MRLFIICLLFFSCDLCPAFAQDDPITEKMKWYAQAKSTSSLFVHFDKNVYSNNETIWFTGYLTRAGTIAINEHSIMAVALIRDVDSTVIIKDKFPMQNGITFGSIVLPDSILTGNYHLLAYTNITVADKPIALFSQSITLKTNIDPAFKASMKIAEAASIDHNATKILVAVTSKDGMFLPKPTNISYKYGDTYHTAKTDLAGQLLITLAQQNHLIDPNLYVKLKYGKDSTFISMPLPQTKVRAEVKFYPEGGNMVVGIPSTIGWEVKDQQKMPLSLKAFLYKNNTVIDTIETSSYGIGQFKVIPELNSNYTVKLVHSGLTDSIYTLPKITDKGLVLSMANAVVQDTLRLTLKSNSPHNVIIRIHNFRESFLYTPFHIDLNTKAIKIPLNEVPKGLASITISDSLDRPLAERIFFAHYNNNERIKLTTNQQLYGQREKVSLKLNLNNLDSQAVVSIACVQDNRIELKKMTDIENYTYLNKELSELPINPTGTHADKNYLEQVLLVKGWRRYTWQDLQQVTAKDTLQQIDSLKISGQVKRYKKELTKPTTISIMGNLQANLINTSDKGAFVIQNEQIFTEVGKKLFLFVNDGNKFPYEIKIHDPYFKMSDKMAKNLPNEDLTIPSMLVNNAELVIKSNEKAIRLKEVTITKKKDNGFSSGKGLPGSNACGDYVCSYGILNCPNHPGDSGNTQPVAGQAYLSNGHSIVYAACITANANEKQWLFPLDGIHLQKEYYVNEYKEPQEPAFFSTLYWNYATLLDATKETEISFYTSDITGRFKIVVQGLTNKDVIYAEKFFEVKPKQNQ